MSVFITTPIYYVNDEPHIGHAYTTMAADVLANFYRFKGEPTFFLTGTDEHGTKIAEKAKQLGKTPQELCDLNSQLFKEAWRNLGISYDSFVRTTDRRHQDSVQRLLEKLHQSTTPDGKKVVYPGEYTGLYCVGCEGFITEKDLVDGLCPNHLTKPQKVIEKNYFFRLSSYLGEVKKLIEDDKIKILPKERKNETLGLFKQNLEDFSLSREKVKWGISLPFDPSQKAYVWVDALQNYISAIGYADNPDQFRKWWKEAKIIHLIGKDILKFHTIFWPAMLLAAKEKPPEVIFIHGYFTIAGQKMSKTLGNQIPPDELLEKFGKDATRYLLLTQFPFGQDGDIQEVRLLEKYNSDLANDFGNLASRVIKMLQSFTKGKIPEPKNYEEEDIKLQKQALDLYSRVFEHLEEIDISSAIEEILHLVKSSNRYIESCAPWNLAKQKNWDRLKTVLYTVSETLRIISSFFYPVLPEQCVKLRVLLGLSPEELLPSYERDRNWGGLKPGSKVGEAESLFPRISASEKLDSKTEEKQKEKQISLDDFAKLDLRVAKVLEAEKVKNTKKLLKLKIEIGEEKREIVAGIGADYTPEEMEGKSIIVVTNLMPVKIRGIQSHGMLLAVSDGKSLSLVTADKNMPSGSKVS